MTSSFTIDKAQIVGLALESMFFGIFLITFPPCIHALVFYDGSLKPPSTIQWPMLFTAIILATFAVLDTAFGLLHNIQAFVLYKDRGTAIDEFMNISSWVNVMKTVDIVFPVLIGDAVLIYRCWVVYNRSYWIILGPLVIWAGGASMALFMIFIEATLRAHTTLHVSQLKPVITSFTILTVVQNIITTTLIILRIWAVDRQAARYIRSEAPMTTQSTPSEQTKGPDGGVVRRKTGLQKIMRIVIESGLMYTTTAVITFCTYITDSNAFNVVTDVEVQIIAIAFNLIIIRARRQPAEEYDYSFTLTTLPHAFGGPSMETGSRLESGLELDCRSRMELQSSVGRYRDVSSMGGDQKGVGTHKGKRVSIRVERGSVAS